MSDSWERARQIAAAASQHDPTVREDFIRHAAGGDWEVETRALALLRDAAPSDTQSLSAPNSSGMLAPGTLLKARYLIIREISRGGFGVVYIAHDQQLHGKPVVVKVQLETLGDDPWFERKFNEEIRALALIDHPGVVGALDSGRTVEGRPFLVMQYVQGRSLRTVITPEGMPLDRIANIVRQIGQALAAAHDKGVWHRDLKPENIMLQNPAGGEEYVRLIDFGIATITDLQVSQRRVATRVAGSLGYMAPEQVDGQPTAATDLYSFGVIAYEMVTGRKPFVPEDAVQLASLQRAGVRVKPADLRPGLPSRAQKLILQALSYNPKDRPASAREFGEQLAQALLAPPGSSTSGNHAVPPSGRHALIGALAAILAAGLGMGAWLLWPRSHPQPAPVATAAVPAPPPALAPAIENKPAPVIISRNDPAFELEFWNAIKNENRPELFREYLTKYPHGQFATVARIRLDELTRRRPDAVAASKSTKPPLSAALPPPPISKLPPPRPALNGDEYNGPLRGQLRWSGQFSPGATLIIQGGRANDGALATDLPRVAVTVDAPPGISVVNAPSEENNWDQLVLRNDSGKPQNTLIIKWNIRK